MKRTSANLRTIPATAFVVALIAGCSAAPSVVSPAPTPASTASPTDAPTLAPTPRPATSVPTSPPTASPAPWPAAITVYPAGRAGNDVGALAYVPQDYGEDSASPLLVFLHGYLESGDGSETELQKLLSGPEHAIPQLIAAGAWPSELPFVVVMPQYSFADAQHCELWDDIQSTIDWAALTYRIDPSRIYLTGISCGAIGIWDYLARTRSIQNKVAATVPISSTPLSALDNGGCAIAKIPMWLFHGALDDNVPVDYIEDTVNELQACTDPPPSEIKMTIYPEGGHDDSTWLPTYDGSAGYDIYTWLLDQRCETCVI